MKFPEHDSLHERGRLLEEVFFQERDRHLLEALRRRLTVEESERVLAAATGVADRMVMKELSSLSAPQFLAILGIFPLVEVAWCDGEVAPAERTAILKAAHDMGIEDGTPAHKLLDQWLVQRPAANAEELWTRYVQAISAMLEPETAKKLKLGVMGRAMLVAKAAGGILGMGSRVSAEEQACLDRLAKAFEGASHTTPS